MKKPVPKKSAVKKVSAKKIKAPKAFKPAGKPKEYLAYLNKREMELLKKFNGGTIKLGPRGLPSFADDSASSQGVSRGDTSQGTKGSGSTKTSTGSVSNKSTSSAGNRGPTGPSGEARTSPAGGGTPGGTTRNSGNAGAGQGGQNDKGFGGVPGTASRSGGSLAQKGQTSPMGGQGSSFKTPAAASSYNKTVAKPSSPMGGQGASFSDPQKAAAYNRGAVPKSPMSGQGASFKTPSSAFSYNKQVSQNLATGRRPSGSISQTGAPPGMLGTPRGYVRADDLVRVDRAMGPVATIGMQLPYFAPGVAPLVGGVLGGVGRLAAPVVNRTISSAISNAAKVAEMEKVAAQLDRARAAMGARVGTSGELAVDFNKLKATESLAQQRARNTPVTGEKAWSKVHDVIDDVTDALGLGTGDKARMKASQRLGTSGHITYEVGNRLNGGQAEPEAGYGKTDRQPSGRYGGSGGGGGQGYRNGGLVRRTFKNK